MIRFPRSILPIDISRAKKRIRSYRCRRSPIHRFKLLPPLPLGPAIGVAIHGALSRALVVAVIEFQLCRSTGEVPYMLLVVALFLAAIRCPRTPLPPPPPPLTRYKRGGYLCPEWYRRAPSTAIPCTGIRFTGSSTLSGPLVSFIPRLRISRSCREFLITRRSSIKVPAAHAPSLLCGTRTKSRAGRSPSKIEILEDQRNAVYTRQQGIDRDGRLVPFSRSLSYFPVFRARTSYDDIRVLVRMTSAKEYRGSFGVEGSRGRGDGI